MRKAEAEQVAGVVADVLGKALRPIRRRLADLEQTVEPRAKGWPSGQTYHVGDRVRHKGDLYMADAQHAGFEPGYERESVWRRIGGKN